MEKNYNIYDYLTDIEKAKLRRYRRGGGYFADYIVSNILNNGLIRMRNDETIKVNDEISNKSSDLKLMVNKTIKF